MTDSKPQPPDIDALLRRVLDRALGNVSVTAGHDGVTIVWYRRVDQRARGIFGPTLEAALRAVLAHEDEADAREGAGR